VQSYVNWHWEFRATSVSRCFLIRPLRPTRRQAVGCPARKANSEKCESKLLLAPWRCASHYWRFPPPHSEMEMETAAAWTSRFRYVLPRRYCRCTHNRFALVPVTCGNPATGRMAMTVITGCPASGSNLRPSDCCGLQAIGAFRTDFTPGTPVIGDRQSASTAALTTDSAIRAGDFTAVTGTAATFTTTPALGM